MPTTCEWEVIVNPEWPITMITGLKEILLSLRPDYTQQFQDKPRLDELLGRQPRGGPLPKRKAAGEWVSPRKPKLLRSTFPSMRVTPMATLLGDYDVPDNTPNHLPLQNPSPSSVSSQLPPPVPQTHAPDENQQDRKPSFPGGFLACDILERTSQYMVKRHGNHGRFRGMFRHIFGNNYSKTTEADLPKNYPKAYAHFRTLDYDRQTTITWNELIKSCDDTTLSSNNFIHFTPPQRPCPSTPQTPPLSTRNTPTFISNLTSPPSSTPLDIPTPPPPPMDHLAPVSNPPQLPARFPLNAKTLRLLNPDEQATLNADAALIRATRVTLGDGISAYSDDCIFSQELAGLRCPFCDTELPGERYSDALLAMLNSPTIQVNTVHDPTSNNPNHRRSLVGHNAYSHFCAQHTLEELTPVARSHGWPYPPDFSTLPQRIKDKKGFLDAVIIGIMTNVDVSTFYFDLLAMNDKQRYNRSLNIISAG
jgi:hypothetical protein